MVTCPHCGQETPAGLNFCKNCGGALKFSARFRSWGLRAKNVPTRAKAGFGVFKTKARTKALSVIGGGPKAAKAQAAAAAPEAGMYPEARGIFGGGGGGGSRSSFSKDKIKTAGAGAAGLFILIGFVLFFLQLFGIVAMPGLMINLIIFGLLGIFCAAIVAKKGSPSLAILVCFIIVGIGYGSYYMQATTTGTWAGGKVSYFGVQATEYGRQVGGEFNVFGQLLTGTYNPENMWRSDIVKSEYAGTENVGVSLLDVKPLRDEFTKNQQLSIQGRIDAVSFPKTEGVNVAVTACSLTGLIPTECPVPIDPEWTCCISSSCSNSGDPQLKDVSEARNRAFSCNHAALGKENPAYPVEVTVASQNTVTVAGKQFLYVDPNYLLTLNPGEDIFDRLKISKDAMRSWQTGDTSIDVGLGVAGGSEFLEATGETGLEYYLGINIANPASHAGVADVDTVELFLPTPPVNITASMDYKPDFNCGAPGANIDFASLGLAEIQAQTLTRCEVNVFVPPLKAGDRKNYFISIKIPKEQLANQDYGTFFVLARLTFNYENKQTVPLVVKESVGGATPVTPIEPVGGII